MEPSRTLVIACATVIEEMLPWLPVGMQYQVFEFGLHVNPDRLRIALQEGIDVFGGQFDTIILGYGLCSQALVGIKANGCQLVVPRVDDCISIFLGSRSEYTKQTRTEPGTYYLTKGWIEVGDTPFSEYDKTVQQYGQERADKIYRIMMGNYTRLAFINTGQYEVEKYRQYTQDTADKFKLRYEEIPGSSRLVKKLLEGTWDDDFVVLPPGETFQLEHFIKPS